MEIDVPAQVELDSAETLATNNLNETMEEAEALEAQGHREKAIIKYKEILSADCSFPKTDKIKEECAFRAARSMAQLGRAEEVMELLTSLNIHFARIPKARAAKIVRLVLDAVATVPDSTELQLALCEKVVAWCRAEKRTFLRQRIESRFAHLLMLSGRYAEAQTLVVRLLRELKKLDDKQLLVETHLVEARISHALRNIPKAKAALTASRTAGNSIYIVPLLQGEIDQVAGTLHCEEADYKTAFSYFLEAYEAFDQNGDSRAGLMLQYMILCKILQGSSQEVPALLSGKWGIKHSGKELEALAKVAAAAKKRSLEDYDTTMSQSGDLLKKDVLIQHHLDALYNQLLESNLLKVIEPFSCVEISRVSELINLPCDKVERKISQMILDGKFLGILDQGKGQLIAYEESPVDQAFAHGLEVVNNMGSVVDSLFKRAQVLVK